VRNVGTFANFIVIKELLSSFVVVCFLS